MHAQSLLNRAALVLRKVGPDTPADEALRIEMAARKSWSAVERRALTRAVYSYFRWLLWLPEKEAIQAKVDQALSLQDRFEKNEKDIKPQALAARAVPEWLAGEMELPVSFLRQLQRQPTLWMRSRKGLEQQVATSLEDCDVVETTIPGAARPLKTLRYKGTRDLYRSPDFQAGRFEIQDLASQAVGLLCNPQPGETWWDTCAGQGGKTLHLADLMDNKGLLWATDRSKRRLDILAKRAARAEVFNYRVAAWEGEEKLPTKTLFDGILIDAPCSGVGTWQRNPHARWTTSPQDVAELSQVQKRLLTHACVALREGGRLVYSVCTLTRSETTGVIEAFLRTHTDFTLETSTTLVPGEFDANGMYIAVLRKK
jgi:16S rRNA (cytosine967-C5)-methyltransferase